MPICAHKGCEKTYDEEENDDNENVEIIKMLLDSGKSNPSHSNLFYNSALMYACLGDNIEIVKMFISIGLKNSDINQVISLCRVQPKGTKFQLQLGFRDNNLIQILKCN